MATKAKKAYDVVVIGAGNGGLVAAIRILQAGYSCLLLEKHNLPGGFATSFKRGRFEFEASLHELNDFGSPEEPGDVRTLFRSLGVEDKIDWVRIPEAYHLITTDKKYDCVMPFGQQAFIDKMVNTARNPANPSRNSLSCATKSAMPRPIPTRSTAIPTPTT